MRLINYTDRKTLEIKQIRAVKNNLISKFEILLPYRYKMMYVGSEWVFANRDHMDLDTISIKACNNRIIIVNLDPKPIDYIWICQMSEEDAIEAYKYIVANCCSIVIILNEDKTLNDVEVAYQINGIGVNDEKYNSMECIYLVDEEDKYDSSVINIAREHYE